MGTTSRLIMIASCVLLAAFTSLEAWFAPKAELDSRWLPSDPAATERVDHSAWDWLLKAYVASGSDGINRVAYARVTAVDRQALADYIARLAATPVTKLNRAEQRTYWINLYNALTVQLVLEHYPLGSIRDAAVKGGPWKSKLVTVEGVPLSLDEIEHHILRPIWHDPRIHYAVNCASLAARTYSRRRSPQTIPSGCSKRRRAPTSIIRGVSMLRTMAGSLSLAFTFGSKKTLAAVTRR